MPEEHVETWLKSNRSAKINHRRLKPLEHNVLKGAPILIQKGQGGTYFLVADDKSIWILKKFYSSRCPDRTYLEKVASILPSHDSFSSGFNRAVLQKKSLARERGHHYSEAFADWLDGSLLMPKVNGVDWSTLADEVRENRIQLDKAQRVALCRGLSESTRILEQQRIAHRDLSSGNVFIDTNTWTISLIDFDSLYHPSLAMPQATTCGTVGYTPPYAWKSNALDARMTWSAHADRYALALLNTEFLVFQKNAPLSAEGGMFDQDELRSRSGKSIKLARKALAKDYPAAENLFHEAIHSSHFDQCPSPEDWLAFCGCCHIKPPKLSDLNAIKTDEFEQVLKKQRPASPLWPAPSLADMPTFEFGLFTSSVPAVTLPPDPWEAP